jgi:hypothetical protein
MLGTYRRLSRFSGVARILRASAAWHSYINTVSTYTYVRTKHLQQVSARVAIRWRQGVKSKS